MKYKFTEEEKIEIKKTMGIITDDIRELWKASQVEEVRRSIHFKWNDLCCWDIVINDKEIYLDERVCDKRIWIESTNIFGIKKRPINYAIAFQIIKNYQQLRGGIEAEIISASKDKSSTIHQLQEIQRLYTKDATIELEFPASNNQHEVEISREDGKTVGTINFGNRLIRIITDGDIVLSKSEKKDRPKVKKLI